MRSDVDLFDEMLTITADLFYPIEHQLFLSTLNIAGKRILDVGCGNGAYMSKVHDSYPYAHLTGIEYQDGIFQQAVKRTNEQMDFHCMSYEEFPLDQLFDVVILRLVVLHLPDKAHFLNWLKRVTHDESVIVILEIDNEQLNDNKQLPLFSAIYKQSRQKLRQSSLLDAKDAIRIELAYYGLVHQRTTTYSIDTSTSSKNIKTTLYTYMQLVAQSITSGPLPLEVSNELQNWYLDPEGKHEVHMFGMVFRAYT